MAAHTKRIYEIYFLSINSNVLNPIFRYYREGDEDAV